MRMVIIVIMLLRIQVIIILVKIAEILVKIAVIMVKIVIIMVSKHSPNGKNRNITENSNNGNKTLKP